MKMTRLRTGSLLALPLVAASIGMLPATAFADDDNKLSVGATFGRGINTAQPGNKVNHVILPNVIKVKTGGVVNFTVAGFHDIFVFKPGTKLEDLMTGGVFPSFPPAFVFDPTGTLPAGIADRLYYRGPNPAGGPLQTLFPAPGPINNALNRSESVAFLSPGTYLVICNIRPHLLDGMWAVVRVSDGDKD
jgi:plastocyanin